VTVPLPGQPDPYAPGASTGNGWTAPLPSPSPGYPQPGYPQAGYPQPGYPPAGFPPNGYPPNAFAPPYPPFPPPAPTGPRNGFGVTALVCGLIGALLGLVIYLFAVTAILGIVAVVFGILGTSRARRGEATNTGVAVAGTVLGLVACVASVLGVVAVVHRISHGVGKIGNYVECVSQIPSGDPQYDAKVQNCLDRFD
jgi:hypothetical protein